MRRGVLIEPFQDAQVFRFEDGLSLRKNPGKGFQFPTSRNFLFRVMRLNSQLPLRGRAARAAHSGGLFIRAHTQT